MTFNINPLQPFSYLQARTKLQPDGLLYDSLESKVTNQQALEFTQKIVTYFRQLGIKRGDVVALNMPSPLHILFMLASWHEATISSAYSESIGKQNSWKPDWIISTLNYKEDAARQVIKLDENLINTIESLPRSLHPQNYVTSKDYVRILFSSGTTGTPKGIPFSLEILNNRDKIRQKFWLSDGPFMSLFDVGALGGFGTFHGQYTSNKTYIVPGDATHNIRQIIKHEISHLQGSPNQISALLDIIEQHEYKIETVDKVTSAGSQASPYLAGRIRDVLSAQVLNIYASTEGGVVSYRTSDSSDPSDLGEILPHVKVEIVDEFHNSLNRDEVGTIRIKSTETVNEYFRESEVSRKFFKDGWFYPGDSGWITSKNQLYLGGRNDELINSGGQKIDPAKIDNYIIGKLGIVDAGGFSFNGQDQIEIFGLAVVSDGISTDSEIIEELKLQFGNSSPKIIYRVSSIPRNERGKTIRRLLAENYLSSIL